MNLALVKEIVDDLEANQPIVRAVIIESSGSTPRGAGTTMLVRPDGSTSGTVGGGPVEAAAREAAIKALSLEKGRELDFNLTGQDAAQQGMLCGGRVKLLIDYRTPSSDNLALFREMADALVQRQSPLLLTELDPAGQVGNRGLFAGPEDDRAVNFWGSDPKPGLQTGASAPYMIEAGERRALAEPLAPAAMLYLIGAGHVAQATAHMAALVDFNVIVLDDRAEFADRDHFPLAQEVRLIPDYHHGLPSPLGPDDYVLVATRGHLHDQEALAMALAAGPGYLGMIGSKRKREAIYANLRAAGVDQASLDRVYCPVGLTIGAETPREIAVSIIGQLIAHRAGALGPGTLGQ